MPNATSLPVLVYVTCADKAEAERIAEAVVAEKLAACANIIPDLLSVFHWGGSMQKTTECLCLFKCTQSCFEALSKRVKELHSYELPCITALPIIDGDPDYMAWVANECRCV